ncbi:peroxidase-related enzyme [Paenirhodobacter populi]|uniref:Alkylhydroperoxidase n=1 Tax=Paenirhodobacter populi TaxID=2306993 RepID=A0A443IXA0_9RHOB|nr:peroxidase-related enzyme [Sinirhodobacter populi]RWR08740.1 alkylhydroperoxidase [Sinirhodobacter populi]RWR12719.1 alkylhydroperoxidase [Sinirhodobacter populi]RWR22539.1 alkylhydroperoxidase [Sinirhodobacter populi]RWR30007.1 alkylhydroperoxidase [Sinirhodobacter populi]
MSDKIPFTFEELVWKSWSHPARLEDCTPAQIAVLEESDPSAKTNEYYLTLIRDEQALKARSQLYNAIMYPREGARRADREFAATAESRVNGCVFCASVHARLFVTFGKDRPSMAALLDEGIGAELPPKLRAIADFAAALAAVPPAAGPEHVAALREVGYSDAEIGDIGNAVAMFAWANRLMLTLGEPERKA